MTLTNRLRITPVHGLPLTAAFILGLSAAAAAQTAPPISGVTGTVALEGTVDAVDDGAHTVAVKSVDGVKHVFHAARGLLVHGKAGGSGALTDLRAGTTVAVHYTEAGGEAAAQEIDQIGADGMRMTEGVVTHVDRERQEITIRLQGGGEETLQLTERAAATTGKDAERALSETSKVAVYYTDEAGRKVVHFFRKAS